MTIIPFICIRINEIRQNNPSISWFIYLFILNKLIIIIIIILGIIRIQIIRQVFTREYR